MFECGYDNSFIALFNSIFNNKSAVESFKEICGFNIDSHTRIIKDYKDRYYYFNNDYVKK